MVTTGVTPHVGHGAQSQCADGVVGVVAHQRGHLFAVHRLADVAVGQQRAVDGKPAVLAGARKRRHAAGLMSDGQPLPPPRLLALPGFFIDASRHLRRGVVGVEMIVVGLDVLRMVEVAVVTLSVVFPDEFPVGAHGVVDRPGDLCAIDALWLEHRLQLLAGRAKIDRAIIEVYENEAAQILRRHRHQAKRVAVQLLVHSAAGQQFAVLAVDPLVVRADELPGRAARLSTEQRAAMAADVVKRPHDTVLPPDDDQRVRAHVKGEVIPGTGDLAVMPGKEPALPPHPVKVGLIDFVRGKKFTRQTAPLRTGPGGRGRIKLFGCNGHGLRV